MHVHYITAKNDFANGRIVEAEEVFEELGDYADSSDYLEKCHNVIKLSNTIQEYRREVGDGSDYIPNRIMHDNPMQYSNFMNMLENVSKQANGKNKYGETGKTFFIVGVLVIFGFLLGLIPFSITESWGHFICILTSAIFIPVKFIDGILKKIGIGIGIFMGGAILLELTQIFTLLFLIAGVVSVGAGVFYYQNGGGYEMALTKARSYYNNIIQPLEDSIRSDVNKRYPIDKEFQVYLQGILKTNL